MVIKRLGRGNLHGTIDQATAKPVAALAAKNDSDNDSDDEFPSDRRLLSPEYRQKFLVEGSVAQVVGTAQTNSGEAIDVLFGLHRQPAVAKVGVLNCDN